MKGIRYYVNSECDAITEIKTCYASLHSSKAHLHNEISIGIIEKGSCNLEVYNKNYFLEEKTILIIPNEIIHKCSPTDLKNWSFKMIYINEEWLKNGFYKNSEIIFKYKKLEQNNYKKIIDYFSKLGKSKLKIEQEIILFEILMTINLYDNFNIIENKDNYTLKIEKIKKYIDNYYLENIGLSELVSISGVSKYYIIRKFEEIYGISPYKYINSKKSAHAKNLLRTNSNIADVAVISGFYDQSHFNKIFKEYSGVTPFQYLKNLKK